MPAWRAEPWSGALVGVLERARSLGFLGPGPVEAHIDQADGLADLIDAPTAPVLDLGAGAGVPGLVLALRWPSSTWVLLDSMVRRTQPLTEAVRTLELTGRVRVVTARAEAAGRDPELRGTFGLVTARSFGPPATTAECGAPFLRVGGILAVSEPPVLDPTRWPAAELDEVGLRHAAAGPGWWTGVAVAACPSHLPRRVGLPAKRPLW